MSKDRLQQILVDLIIMNKKRNSINRPTSGQFLIYVRKKEH